MQRGVVFTVEAVYAVGAVFALLLVFVSFMPITENPNYDIVATLKVAHDMGQENNTNPPTGFYNDTFGCGTNTTANLPYYDIGEVCFQ